MNVRQARLLEEIGRWFKGPDGPGASNADALAALESRVAELESRPRPGRPKKTVIDDVETI